MYELYLSSILFPVAPSKIQTKIKNQNKTLNLINGNEINMLKEAGLSEVSFDLLLPNVQYPFAIYKRGFRDAKYFLDFLEFFKKVKKPFYFKLLRTFPNGKFLYNSEMKVSLEDYTIKEDAKQGFDVVVSVKLKQYRDYGTKIYKDTAIVTPRSTENAPKGTTYTVKEGDTLFNIAKYFYGNGQEYMTIYNANKSVIGNNPNLIYPGQVLTIPEATQQGNGSPSGVSPSRVSPSGVSNTQKITQHSVAIKFGGLSAYYGTVDVIYTKDGKPFVEKGRLTPITITADYNTVVKITVNSVKGGTAKFISNTSDRQITWKLVGTDTQSFTEQAKIYNNAVVTINWSKLSFEPGLLQGNSKPTINLGGGLT